VNFDIVIAGVGGQGVLTLASILARAARADGLEAKLSEVHGMAQRGGSVLAHLRIADRPVQSPLIPTGSAHLLLATEPLEALRHLALLDPSATVVSTLDARRDIAGYPDEGELLDRLRGLPSVRLVEAARQAREAGAPKGANLVLLGTAVSHLPVREESLERAVAQTFGDRGREQVEPLLAAFRAGRARVDPVSV
jgi:indolepyruvate ferredoxin oxidoreductase beta subunit